METLTTLETLTTTELVTATAFLGGFLGTILTLGAIFYVLLVIADWKIFTKAGEKGWKSIIPIYNIYIGFKIIGMKAWFWPLIIACLVQSMVSAFAGQQAIVSTIVAIIVGVFELVAYIVYCGRTAKAFGKGTGFAVGTFFFPNIFTLILGFGSAEYKGIEEE